MTLQDRLRSQQRKYFVGRGEELEKLGSAIETESQLAAVFVHGAAGVGKSTLLKEFAGLCTEAGVPSRTIDCREIEPTPDGFRQAWALGHMDSDSAPKQVLQIDNYESLEQLDQWIREDLIPGLPINTVVVIAGRKGPSPGWRTDLSWHDVLATVELHNLTSEEGKRYLASRSVPEAQHLNLLKFTRGHPLALSLVADVVAQEGGSEFHPESSTNIINTLIERFLEGVPSKACRAALDVCALTRVTNEALLEACVPQADAGKLFEWLRKLSFIETGHFGVFPHELVRDALALDLKWRNPDRYAQIHKQAGAYYAAKLNEAHDAAQHALIFDYIFLHRDNPVVSSFFHFDASTVGYVDLMQDADVKPIVDMVRKHEGEESAKIAAYWLERQPDGVTVIRAVNSAAHTGPLGFVAAVALHAASEADCKRDPAVASAIAYLKESAPLRPGEKATLFRFWMGADDYQTVSPTQSLLFVRVVRHYLTEPGLAFTMMACADCDLWTPVFAYAAALRIAEAEFTIGGHTYAVFGHDWRLMPPQKWLQMLSERELAYSEEAAPAAAEAAAIGREAFEEAALEALKNVASGSRLQENALLASRIVSERATADGIDRVRALQALVKDAALELRGSVGDRKLLKALRACYFEPVGPQLECADRLEIGIATLRRHLREGEQRVVDYLWKLERNP